MELSDYKAAHRALWDWLANNPGKDKDEWPGWEGRTPSGGQYNGQKIPSYCFMCAWNDVDCTYCALAKKYGIPCYYSSVQLGTGLYQQWSRAMGYDTEGAPDYDTACRIAAEIRDSWED